MTERHPFPHLTDDQLAARIERAEPFKSDDEERELNRRLGEKGLAWMYDRETRSKVVMYRPGAQS